MKSALKVLVLIALGVAAGLFVLSGFVGRYVTAERLAVLAEKEINSRVQIGAARVDLFRFPARLVLRDVVVAPRDGEVGRPYGEREALPGGVVEVGELRLGVSLGALLRRRIEIDEFVFREPRINVTLREDGTNTLEELLGRPGNPAEASPGEAPATSGSGEEDALNIHQSGFLARIEGVRIERGNADLTIEKTKLRVSLRGLDAVLDAIEVNPAALWETNEARLRLKSSVGIESSRRDGLRYALLELDGPARVKLFDEQTGDFDLDVTADISIGKDSYLNAEIPTVQKAWRTLQLLEEFGVVLGDLPPRAEFGRSRSVTARYHRDRVTLLKPLSVLFGDWEVALLDESWLQLGTEEHAASAEFLASARLSAGLWESMTVAFNQLPKEIRPEVATEIRKAWYREGQLVAEIVSAGGLSEPKVTVLNKLPDVKEIAARAASRFARERLDRLAEDLLEKLRDGD